MMFRGTALDYSTNSAAPLQPKGEIAGLLRSSGDTAHRVENRDRTIGIPASHTVAMVQIPARAQSSRT